MFRNAELTNQLIVTSAQKLCVFKLFLDFKVSRASVVRLVLVKKKPNSFLLFNFYMEKHMRGDLPSWHNYREGISLQSVSYTSGRECLCERSFKIW